MTILSHQVALDTSFRALLPRSEEELSQPLGVVVKWISKGVSLATQENTGGKRKESKGEQRIWCHDVEPLCFFPHIFLTEPLGPGEVVGWSHALWMLYCVWNIKLLHKKFVLWNVKFLACIVFVKWGYVSWAFQHGLPLYNVGEKFHRGEPKPSEAALFSVSKVVKKKTTLKEIFEKKIDWILENILRHMASSYVLGLSGRGRMNDHTRSPSRERSIYSCVLKMEYQLINCILLSNPCPPHPNPKVIQVFVE